MAQVPVTVQVKPVALIGWISLDMGSFKETDAAGKATINVSDKDPFHILFFVVEGDKETRYTVSIASGGKMEPITGAVTQKGYSKGNREFKL